jgi:hypothetical protein
MAAGDMKHFVSAAADLAKDIKRVTNKAKELRDFWDKLDLLNNDDAIELPLTKGDMTNMATLCTALQNFCDNVAVTAADRRQVIERVGTQPFSR